MKKMFLLKFLMIFLLVLVGCDDEKYYSQNEARYNFESIEFVKDNWSWDKAIIDTNEKTIVAKIDSLSFVKSKEKTSLKVVSHLYKEEKSSSRPTEYILYVDGQDLKEISKKYANTFKSTIQVSEEEHGDK